MSREGQKAMVAFLAAGGKITICPATGIGERLVHFDEVNDAKIKADMSRRGKAASLSAVQARTMSRRDRRTLLYSGKVPG